ncbi:MAG: hypothetical protein A2X69_07205 [Rhodobacteraceae bacterium GWF1_65_7]|nr:MAG: hypothetical protein A2X69_07205 [Rhodobacteraceae bacterium GWF1_65_7]
MIQLCRRSDEREKQNAARIMKGTVGKTGVMTPISPSPSAMNPQISHISRISKCLYQLTKDCIQQRPPRSCCTDRIVCSMQKAQVHKFRNSLGRIGAAECILQSAA